MLDHGSAMWRFTETRQRAMLCAHGQPRRPQQPLLYAITDGQRPVSKPKRQLALPWPFLRYTIRARPAEDLTTRAAC